MLNAMSNHWWVLVARGVFAILFGLAAIFMPGITLAALIFIFGAYVLLDGGFNIYASLMNRGRYERWWIGLIEGGIGVLAGLGAFFLPGVTGLVLLYLIAFWAVLTGVAEIAAAFELRKQIQGEWLLGISGVLSILFGVLLILSPGTGALAVAWLIGFYAMLFGVTMVALGFRVRNEGGDADSSGSLFSTG